MPEKYILHLENDDSTKGYWFDGTNTINFSLDELGRIQEQKDASFEIIKNKKYGSLIELAVAQSVNGFFSIEYVAGDTAKQIESIVDSASYRIISFSAQNVAYASKQEITEIIYSINSARYFN